PTQLRIYGAEKPVKAYVFTSFSCPHCTVFHKNILPEMKNMVDDGKIQIVMVEMPYDARAMTGTALARCLPPKNYDKFAEAMFDNQQTWSSSKNPKPIITGYAKLLGMSEGQINSCLSDKKLISTITDQRNNLSDMYGVTGMPSVVLVSAKGNKLLVGTDKKEIMSEIQKKVAEK
ncbi:MAG: thioredoxin domain-containing protein, partial [Alphaproteobacteria bacterium]|nr:thioredoxin domain-containing protein [Alphaproteobacteria bacterium]